MSRRSWPVRLLDRVLTGRQGARRGPRAWRALAGWFGRHPDRWELAAGCRQCGDWRFVVVLRLGPRRARYWCQRCGALVTLADPAVLRPVPDLRAAAQPPGAGPAPVDPAVREVMPAAMVTWLAERATGPVTLAGLDRSTIYRLYREWDAQATPPGLPAFSTVVGRSDDLCYHTERVVDSLLGSAPEHPGLRAALAERAEHARRWLASRPRDRCWIHAGLPGGELATPDPPEVAAALGQLRSGAEPGPELALAARAAMFGTVGGPALRTLQAVYPPEVMVEALETYLRTGARPLRDDALTRLAGEPA